MSGCGLKAIDENMGVSLSLYVDILSDDDNDNEWSRAYCHYIRCNIIPYIILLFIIVLLSNIHRTVVCYRAYFDTSDSISITRVKMIIIINEHYILPRTFKSNEKTIIDFHTFTCMLKSSASQLANMQFLRGFLKS